MVHEELAQHLGVDGVSVLRSDDSGVSLDGTMFYSAWIKLWLGSVEEVYLVSPTVKFETKYLFLETPVVDWEETMFRVVEDLVVRADLMKANAKHSVHLEGKGVL